MKAMPLKESKEGHMDGFGGTKRTEKWWNYITSYKLEDIIYKRLYSHYILRCFLRKQ